MRVLLRILSPLLGLALAALGALVALETAVAWLRPASSPLAVPWPTWRHQLDGLSWASTTVRVVAALLAVLGVALLLAALSARRHEVRLADPAPEVTMTTSPRSLARLIGHQVRSMSDVASASVTASARKVSVRAGSRGPAGGVKPAVAGRVQELLADLPLSHPPRVSVDVTPTKELA